MGSFGFSFTPEDIPSAVQERWLAGGSVSGTLGDVVTSIRRLHLGDTYWVEFQHGALFVADDSGSTNAWAVDDYMKTNQYGFTSFRDCQFERGMNSWLGKDIYYSVTYSLYSQLRNAILRSYETGYAVAVNAQERRGSDYHPNDCNNGTFAHVMAIDGFDTFDRVPNVGVRAASLAVESRKRLSPRILIAEVRIRRKAITAYGQDTRDCGRRRPDAEIR